MLLCKILIIRIDFLVLMKVYIERNDEKRAIRFKGSVGDLLGVLKINSETVLVVRDSQLLMPDDLIDDSDEIRILSVISGG